jgi:hypothetical protein
MANPYHDKRGRFTTAAGNVLMSAGRGALYGGGLAIAGKAAGLPIDVKGSIALSAGLSGGVQALVEAAAAYQSSAPKATRRKAKA